jgi:hypothetical protein
MAFAFVSIFLMNGACAGANAQVPASWAEAGVAGASGEQASTFPLLLAQGPPAIHGPVTSRPATLPALPPVWDAFPGEFAMRTHKGYYLAINGGGRATDPTVITASTSAGPWEKFRLAVMNPAPPNDKSIQTASGNYLTAVNGGGMTANALHTDATQVRDWEQFRLLDLGAEGSVPTYFSIRTIRGNYLTAIGEGGNYEDAIHTDATQIKSWEQFRIVKCGDLGSEYQYTIIAADDQILTAVDGGGRSTKGDTIVQGGWFGYPPDGSWSRFKLMRQSDGSYALQTSNGTNYVTALGGGGQVQKFLPADCGFPGACISGFSSIFHTDATQIRAWERFRFIDQGNCKYAIQTVSGYYFGVYKDSNGYMLFTTDRSTISENEKFQLVMYGLASPVVLH